MRVMFRPDELFTLMEHVWLDVLRPSSLCWLCSSAKVVVLLLLLILSIIPYVYVPVWFQEEPVSSKVKQLNWQSGLSDHLCGGGVGIRVNLIGIKREI